MADTIIVTTNIPTVILSKDVNTSTIITSGIQGPQGPPGVATIQLVAGISLGGNRVVTGAANYADNTDIATAGRAIGMTQGAAVLGATVNIVTVGELDGFSGLTINNPVYLSTNGTTTQVLPITGYIQRIGVAISATKILINLSEPLGLI